MKICEAGRSSGCCSNPNIRTINTMSADTVGNFEIRAGNSVSITTETNGIKISYTGGITTYENTDGNIEIDNDLFTINLADDLTITGDMIIAGDLTVNGTYYTVHAEHVYTQDDYIILREGATTPLTAGSYAGFQVTKYDGTNDGRLVIDNAGVARVGDVGDEQPLMTRSESASLTNGNLLQWNGTGQKAVDAGVNTSQIVRGSGNIGSDTKPIKIVNGVATAVTNDLIDSSTTQTITVNKQFNGDIVGSISDVGRYDLHLCAYNPTTQTIAKLVLAMRNGGGPRLILERWNASVDANGVPKADSYIDGQIVYEYT